MKNKNLFKHQKAKNKDFFICECGEKQQLIKEKLDFVKGKFVEMSEDEIINLQHNQSCFNCIRKQKLEDLIEHQKAKKKDFFDCECGLTVKLTKHKLDTEKCMIVEMSKEEIENCIHNKKCLGCVQKEEDDKGGVSQIWRVDIGRDYYEKTDFDEVPDHTYFKKKDDALQYMKKWFEEMIHYNDLDRAKVTFELKSCPLL